jgi:hypothetical protein
MVNVVKLTVKEQKVEVVIPPNLEGMTIFTPNPDGVTIEFTTNKETKRSGVAIRVLRFSWKVVKVTGAAVAMMAAWAYRNGLL